MSVIDDCDDNCSSSSGGGGTVLPGMAAGADCCTISARTAAPPEHMRSPSSLVTLHTHTCPCSCKILRQVLAAPATLLPLRLHHPLPALLILVVQHATLSKAHYHASQHSCVLAAVACTAPKAHHPSRRQHHKLSSAAFVTGMGRCTTCAYTRHTAKQQQHSGCSASMRQLLAILDVGRGGNLWGRGSVSGGMHIRWPRCAPWSTVAWTAAPRARRWEAGRRWG